MIICKHCAKECKNKNSQRNHERLCKENPDRQYTTFQSDQFKSDPNRKFENQYTKAKRLGLDKPKVSDATKQALREANLRRTKEWNKENGKRISESIKKKVEDGTWHTSLAKDMHIDYNGVDLHGSWELKYAQFLDQSNVKWTRNKDRFSYIYLGKERTYTPDFYLIDTDEYVEIKGYRTEKDDAKWSQFPADKKLTVLMKEDLKRLNLI